MDGLALERIGEAVAIYSGSVSMVERVKRELGIHGSERVGVGEIQGERLAMVNGCHDCRR